MASTEVFMMWISEQRILEYCSKNVGSWMNGEYQQKGMEMWKLTVERIFLGKLALAAREDKSKDR